MNLSSVRKRAGVSLIEVLIVIAVIGLLAAILIPALMRTRKSAGNVECLNNLRQVSMAMQNYVSSQGGFPPLQSISMGWDGPNRTGTIHNWSVYLLPYLDQPAVAALYDINKPFYANTAAVATPLQVFQCPATPQGSRTVTVPWSMSVSLRNNSLTIIDPFLSTPSVTLAAGDYTSYERVNDDWKHFLNYPPGTGSLNGVMMRPRTERGQREAVAAGGSLPLRAPSRRATDVKDGLSNTVVVIESAGRPQHWDGGQISPDQETFLGSAGWADPAQITFNLTGNLVAECLINCNNMMNIYSFHTGGANFALADGSARFISASVSSKTMVALLTAASGDDPGSNW